MDEIQLGPRLAAIASRVVEGRVVADLCCDHAHLAAALVRTGRVPRAIAGDLAAGPLARARADLARTGIEGVDLRLGDGLEVLRAEDEVGTIVLAGIGAPLAAALLERGRAQLAGGPRVIVQPNHGFPKLGELRAALAELGLEIVDEVLARERGRLFLTIVAEGGRGPVVLDPVARELGPIASRGEDPLWGAWCAHERGRIRRAWEGVSRSARADDVELARRYRGYLEMLDLAGSR